MLSLLLLSPAKTLSTTQTRLMAAMHRLASYKLIAICLLGSLPASTAMGQDDPFGFGASDAGADLGFADAGMGGEGIFGDIGLPGEAGAVAQDSGASDQDQPKSPAITQLMEKAGRSLTSRAEAISSLARIGRWAQVDQLLSQINVAGLSDSTKADLASRIGSAQYLKIKLEERVSEQAKSNLDELAKAANEYRRSPKRISAAMKELGSSVTDRRAAAARVLLAGGEASIQALADQLTSAEPVTERALLLSAYRRFGNHLTKPIQRYALYGSDSQREWALWVLIQLRSDSSNFVSSDLASVSTPTWLQALHASDSTSVEREYAGVMFKRRGIPTPSFEAAAAALTVDLERKRSASFLVDRDRTGSTLWSMQPREAAAGSGALIAKPIRTTQLVSAYRDSVDAAARLGRIGRLSQNQMADMLAAEVAYRVMIDPDWGSVSDVKSLSESLRFEVSSELLLESLALVSSQDDAAAMLGLVRWAASDDSLDQMTLFRGSASRPTALVAVASGYAAARIRFEAALAVSKLSQDPAGGKLAYVGNSRVKRTLSEIIRLGDRPKAILVETRGEVALRIEQMLSSVGYQVDVVPSVASLSRLIARPGDLRLILSKVQLADLSAIEMIDLVRRVPHGRLVPIVLFGDQSEGADPDEQVAIGADRWSAPVAQIGMPASIAGLAAVLDEMERSRRIMDLTVTERRAFRSLASELLGIGATELTTNNAP